jgi:hypothetical protein
VARNPQGEFVRSRRADGEEARVHRGGSFLCTDQYCTPYMVIANNEIAQKHGRADIEQPLQPQSQREARKKGCGSPRVWLKKVQCQNGDDCGGDAYRAGCA